ncbi:MAG: inositol oxygenase family protein [Rubripirellula sp.]
MNDPDEWEADLRRRYPSPMSSADLSRDADQNVHVDANVDEKVDNESKSESAFRDYGSDARPSVKEFYRLNHRYQTFDFVQQKRQDFLQLNRLKMSVWEAMEFLNTLVDDSDPDTELSQIEHLMQTAEAIRADGHPRWFVLTGLIHDLGKILCLFGEPQWAVVGDTFPVGCAFSPKIVYHEFFQENADLNHPVYETQNGVYEPHAGLKNVHLSWGHDEYLYHVTRQYLPVEAQYMIRYHSFYSAHRERAYEWMFDQEDESLFEWVRRFNPYDLYSKSDRRPDVEALKPFYLELIDEYFPAKLDW